MRRMLHALKADERFYQRAYKRLAAQNSGVVRDWANTSLWTAQEGLESADPAGLQQARLATIGLLASLDVLLDKEQQKT